MNRIFKVIFSKTLGTNVVAGETARSHGKKSLTSLVAVAMMAGAMGMAGTRRRHCRLLYNLHTLYFINFTHQALWQA